MLTNIVDGWVYNPSIRYLPDRAVPMSLGQLEALRRAHNLRDRQYVFPDDFTVTTIPAGGQFNVQFRVTPNSYLWAGSLFRLGLDSEEGIIPGAPWDAFSPDDPVRRNLSLQITDEQTGCEIASEFISARVFWPGDAEVIPPLDFNTPLSAIPRQSMPPLFRQPRLIVGPGLVSVKIASINTFFATAFQLVLWSLEPCDANREPQQCA